MKKNLSGINMYYGADPSTLRVAGMLRKGMTLSEKILWKKLKDRKIFTTKFRRQHAIEIFIVDFYCHEYKLVIEVDGEIHNDTIQNEHDFNRTGELNRFGIRVLRFTNDQILYDIDSVLAKIQEVITELTPL
jgi:very-short-patch-repair endonuclease